MGSIYKLAITPLKMTKIRNRQIKGRDGRFISFRSRYLSFSGNQHVFFSFAPPSIRFSYLSDLPDYPVAIHFPHFSSELCNRIKNRISFFFKFDSNSHFFKNRKMNLLSFDSHSVCVLQPSGAPLQSFCVRDQLVFLNEGV